jgi:hypothetical protein
MWSGGHYGAKKAMRDTRESVLKRTDMQSRDV